MNVVDDENASDENLPPDIIGDPEHEYVDEEMEASRAPLMDHLIELRTRLIKSLAIVTVAFILCFAVSMPLYNFLIVPYKNAALAADVLPKLNFPPLGLFFARVKLAFMSSIVLSFPFLAYELYKFVAPGLYKNEKRAVFPFLISMPFLFTAGAALVYFMIMPFVMRFAFGMEQQAGDASGVAIEVFIFVGEYLSLITTLILAFGFAFQLPVVLTLLAMAGLISPEGLVKNRRFAIVGIFAVAAFLTPPDPLSQVALGATIWGLYELSIFSVRSVVKKREPKEQTAQG